MYEMYTRQSLPEREYRELLGTSICVFNANCAFIIENIIREDKNKEYTWFDLIDGSSRDLEKPIKETITKKANNTKIANLFGEVCRIRNRIVHSFQITDESGEQVLATKKKGIQYIITKEILIDFIKKNEELSTELHKFRGK